MPLLPADYSILIGVIWLIAKIVEQIGQSYESVRKATEKKRLEQFNRAKSNISAAVSVSMPKELDRAEKRLKLSEVEFAQIQRSTKWSAESPHWSNEEFKQRTQRTELFKRSTYSQMDADDLDSILTP